MAKENKNPAEILKHETDMERIERKVDELTGRVNTMIESIRIFKLNFQQTNLLRK